MKLEILVHKTTQKVTIFNVKTTKKIQQFYTKKIIKKQEFDIQKQVKCKKLGTKNKPNLEFSPQKKPKAYTSIFKKSNYIPPKITILHLELLSLKMAKIGFSILKLLPN
jgi:hypothetical protein